MVESEQTRILPDELRATIPAPGMILRDRYRLDSELGRGGMGTVYRATDLELQREVAVKVLSATSQSSDARERLVREARAAAALNHPHIVTIHDVGESGGFPFLVMELVAGPRLSQARPTELSRVVSIAVQICSALEHAHANSIVHRDLKPDNVLLSGTSELSKVKLADLGLALPAYAARISRAGVIVGTAAYMAPEQALGQTVDGRADLYALGVLLYDLTTGRVPFTGDDPLTIVSQHVHAPVVPPRVLRPDLPRALEAVIVKLLAKDPAQRFSSAAETRKALLDALDGKDELAATDSAPAVAILDALSRGRLVGRNAELTEARELWQRAREGRGHAVLLSGEPGAGKTRLAREITIQAAVDGALVLTGGCYEYEAAMQGRYDEALETASTSLQQSSSGLIYTHFEALRCLATVHFLRNKVDEAERICEEAEKFLAPTESRVSRLWLGPLYIEVLLKAQKRTEAAAKLADYQALVADCQSPRFTAEASRLAAML